MLYTDNSEIIFENNSNSSNRGRRGDDEVAISIENETENQECQPLLDKKPNTSDSSNRSNRKIQLRTIRPNRRLAWGKILNLSFWVSVPLILFATGVVVGILHFISSPTPDIVALTMYILTSFCFCVIIPALGGWSAYTKYKSYSSDQLQLVNGSSALSPSPDLAILIQHYNENENTSSLKRVEGYKRLPIELKGKTLEYSSTTDAIAFFGTSHDAQKVQKYLETGKKNLWEERYLNYCRQVDQTRALSDKATSFIQELKSKDPEKVNLKLKRCFIIYEKGCECLAKWKRVFAKWQRAKASNHTVDQALQGAIANSMELCEKVIKRIKSTEDPLVQFVFNESVVKKWEAELYATNSGLKRFIKFVEAECTSPMLRQSR